MISGLSYVNEENIKVLAALPVSASTVDQRQFPKEDDYSENGITYTYLPFINGKIARYFTLIISTIKLVKQWCKGKKRSNSIVIVDPLVPVLAIPTRIIAQQKKIRVAAIVTDIPTLTTNMKERKEGIIKKSLLSLYQKVANRDLFSYDIYVPLTKSIDEIVNIHGKPSIVIEGFADGSDKNISNKHKSYILYAGGVYEKYGLKNLVEAFIGLNKQDVSLFVFGDGSYVEEIKKIEMKYSNIKYMGCLNEAEVVKYEKEALLLINPRPTNEEFSKYSFPSKTIEYMLSGTPVISTRLPGIPDEYFEYIYSFSDYNVSTMQKELEEILKLPADVLYEKGKKAHEFILKEKNNISMARKMIKFLNEVYKKEK
jgi:glycosyltransferase involved in cell wall biosynthesis